MDRVFIGNPKPLLKTNERKTHSLKSPNTNTREKASPETMVKYLGNDWTTGRRRIHKTRLRFYALASSSRFQEAGLL